MKYRIVERPNKGVPVTDADVIGPYNTREEAEAAVCKANRRLQALPGYSRHWYPFEVQEAATVEYEDGTTDVLWRVVSPPE